MKVVYIACSYATVWLIYSKFKATYDGNHDTFRVEFLMVPTAVLAFLVNHDFTPLEILWTFSIYLESVAILPQLFMVSKTGEAETITSHYLFALGIYRTLYLFNWIWRYQQEGFFDLIAIVAGLPTVPANPVKCCCLKLGIKIHFGEEAGFCQRDQVLKGRWELSVFSPSANQALV
ncbi:ER lumen protein-retaining receptor 1-A [Platysternon megacephalum]|uniref:ER lumen protein-retaining receptor n=1 Tax=Platysternon megacephalum TaxID=55544 RepID=A0A4D9DJ77_9SAUR|nr:ER lumen protein-retaining receptor 1-A [Platysternon megacephalum]